MHKSITLAKLEKAFWKDDNSGFCTKCGHKQGGCEPDARNYECNKCKSKSVYGVEELLLQIA